MTVDGYWTEEGIEHDVKIKSGQLRESQYHRQQDKRRERGSSWASLSVGKAVFKLERRLLTGQNSLDGIYFAPSEPSMVHSTEQDLTSCLLSIASLRIDLAI